VSLAAPVAGKQTDADDNSQELVGGVFLVMEPNSSSDGSGSSLVIDRATLYLCRRGTRWVVILESPRVRSAVRLRHAGGDPFDARFELLSKARQVCPDASILSADGTREDADYEWMLEVSSMQLQPGDLGVALYRELSGQLKSHMRRLWGRTERRHCRHGNRSRVDCRPRFF
jgi:hypothetical protein